MIETKIQRKHLYTPLRYPGGKTSLFEFFRKTINEHEWTDLTYIEPYAGGAGAALSLLILDEVSSIVINDHDPAIHAFWRAVTEMSRDFIKKIEDTPLTVAEWEKQKQIYKAADASDPLKLGFATFYLNRTNRSGILNAGPVGGKDQTGKWKIDARYNKAALISKIKLISDRKDRITVLDWDGARLIRHYAQFEDSFFYVDPPYYVKGADLYLNAFKAQDHEDLASVLNELKDSKWLLTYDSEPEILALYPKRNYRPFDLRYSAHHNTKEGSELMIFSDAFDMNIIDNI